MLAKDVRKSFVHMGRTLEVLKGIDLEIEEGEVASIVGQSGAGKSTLLHCMGTLDAPTSGSIRVAGKRSRSSTARASPRSATARLVLSFNSTTSCPSSTRSRTS